MNAIRLTGCLLVSLATLITLTPATTAFAAKTMPDGGHPPTVENFHFEGSGEDALACDGFHVFIDFVEDVRVITFFDADGNPIRAQIQDKGIATLRNSVTGFSVPYIVTDQVLVDLLKGTETIVGISLRINISDHVNGIIDAGRLVIDADGNVIFEAGHHVAFFGDGPVVCAALSGSGAMISNAIAEDRGSAQVVSCAVRSSPAHGNAVILYTLPVEAHVALSIYDVTGRHLGQLVDGFESPGSHELSWNYRFHGTKPGVYLYRFEALGRSITGRFVLLR